MTMRIVTNIEGKNTFGVPIKIIVAVKEKGNSLDVDQMLGIHKEPDEVGVVNHILFRKEEKYIFGRIYNDFCLEEICQILNRYIGKKNENWWDSEPEEMARDCNLEISIFRNGSDNHTNKQFAAILQCMKRIEDSFGEQPERFHEFSDDILSLEIALDELREGEYQSVRTILIQTIHRMKETVRWARSRLGASAM